MTVDVLHPVLAEIDQRLEEPQGAHPVRRVGRFLRRALLSTEDRADLARDRIDLEGQRRVVVVAGLDLCGQRVGDRDRGVEVVGEARDLKQRDELDSKRARLVGLRVVLPEDHVPVVDARINKVVIRIGNVWPLVGRARQAMGQVVVGHEAHVLDDGTVAGHVARAAYIG